MIEIDTIIEQVSHNCDITDAQHAGLYSICGLALRLRDLFKWEKRLDPWIEKDASEVLEWIGNKEQKWETLAEKQLNPISIFGRNYDPFDARGINAVLEPLGFFYGGGYAQNLKPTFFLAVLENRREINGHPVYILGHELARDLLTLPALSQDDCILIRRESAKMFLWDKIFYIKRSGRNALEFAFKHHGLNDMRPKALHDNLARIVAAEVETYIYHELGEIHDKVFDRDLWREVLAAFRSTPIELLARTVKDLLADTNEYGMLRYVIKERKIASLSFYVAFLEGLTKVLFPEIVDAFGEFRHTRKWHAVERAVVSGFNTARHYAESISAIYLKGMQMQDKKWIVNEVAERLLEPLGVT